MPPQHPAISRAELFSLLAQGHGARTTVLTPNRRLAQALQRDFDRSRQESGIAAWETADVLAFGAFVQRFWEDALHSGLAACVPMLLTQAQEQVLWEGSIRAARIPDAVFSPESAAAQCREAWGLAHAWRLDLRSAGAPNQDVRAYLDWSQRYERATGEKGQTEAARLADVIARLIPHPAIRKPATVALFGFDIVTPQMREFLESLAAQGCAVVDAAAPSRPANLVRVELIESKLEIDAAARWARARLEADPNARIGVVVPDLALSRARVRRLFANVMRPDHLILGASSSPFNLSLGAPLADFPLVGDALLGLALAGPQIAFEQASRVIRSPFIAGAEAEMEVRARLDARLRGRCGPSIALDTLLRLAASPKAPRASLLLDGLARLAQIRKSGLFGAKPAADWAKAFSEALRALGFPGERTLDSTEHQTLDRWHELLAEFATLERVTSKMGFAEACRRLASMASEAIFQPQAPEVPVQVMGVLESAGLEFDHLWVMGLTDEAWPLPARPNAFLPVRLQRDAGIAQADPGLSLELDRRITAGWLRAAGEVVLSHARMKDESEAAPSPLIATLPLAAIADLAICDPVPLRDAIRRGGHVEVTEDSRAPAVALATRAGGTGLFRDQAACPFRAFAHRRLDARPLETPRPGLDPRDRGNLLHEMLALAWTSLRSRERLAAMARVDLDQLLEACADAAIAKVKRKRGDVLTGRFARLEHERLVRLAGEWLAVELRRADFDVVATEDQRSLTFGGITVNARLDRMDRLADSGLAVIDYKTGNCATGAWLGERPDEPQLPMYALADKDVTAVAFGQVKAGEMGFKGIGRDVDLIPGVKRISEDRSQGAKRYRDWVQLIEGWRKELDALGRAFATGDARVDPKDGPDTCKTCDQHAFCRIAEKAPFGVVREGDPDE